MSERWGEIDRVIQQALDKPDGERDTFIESACGADAELSSEVRSMLRRYQLEDSGPIGKMVNTVSFFNALRRQGLQPGTRVAKYEVLSPLGSGGMGDVYLARDVVLERKVALKVLAVSYGGLAGVAMPVFSEARAASSLNHLNIVIVYDAGESEGRQYLAAEYIQGGTLRDRLNAGPMRLADALNIAIQIASALGAAHAAGVVHRDLKPENVMVRPDGVAKVVDFGIAKIRESLPACEVEAARAAAVPASPDASSATRDPGGVIIGSVPYMSPEQASGQAVDSRSDIFSFGAVLYELVTGSRAFPGNSDRSVLRAVAVRTPPAPPRGRRIPAALRKLVYRCLEKDSLARPQSMTEIQAELETIRARLERGPRMRLMVAALAAAALAIAAFVWFRPSAVPQFVPVRITNSAAYKEVTIAFDGSNVFFDRMKGWNRSSVRLSLNGNNEIPLDVPPDANVEVQDDAPGLNRLLMRSWTRGYGVGAFWFFQFPEGKRIDVPQAVGYSGAWSRDGSRIAYFNEERNADGEQRAVLYVATLDGKLTRICNLDDIPKRPPGAVTWTPDGRVWFIQDTRLFEVEARQGATPHPVFAAKDGPQGPGRWTADGKSFFFSDIWTQDLWMLRGNARASKPSLFRLSSGPFQYGTPAPSRDGKVIYAVGQLRRGRIMRFDRSRDAWIPMIEGLSADGLDFSPDGRKLAYVSYPEGEMWISNSDGSARRQITYEPMRAFLPRWSPDGKQITFMGRSPGEPWRAYLLPGAGQPIRRLMPGAGTEATPSWSPDGTKIVYAPFPWDVDAPQRHISTYDISTHRTSVAPGTEALSSPAWSPDGRYIAANRFQHYGLNPVVLYDCASRQVKDLGVVGTYLSWSRDSRFVYLLRKPPFSPASVLRVSVDGGEPEPVARYQGRLVANSPVPSQESIWLGFTPQREPITLQDLGNREIYELRAR